MEAEADAAEPRIGPRRYLRPDMEFGGHLRGPRGVSERRARRILSGEPWDEWAWERFSDLTARLPSLTRDEAERWADLYPHFAARWEAEIRGGP